MEHDVSSSDQTSRAVKTSEWKTQKPLCPPPPPLTPRPQTRDSHAREHIISHVHRRSLNSIHLWRRRIGTATRAADGAQPNAVVRRRPRGLAPLGWFRDSGARGRRPAGAASQIYSRERLSLAGRRCVPLCAAVRGCARRRRRRRSLSRPVRRRHPLARAAPPPTWRASPLSRAQISTNSSSRRMKLGRRRATSAELSMLRTSEEERPISWPVLAYVLWLPSSRP